jgi:hypothetical protein
MHTAVHSALVSAAHQAELFLNKRPAPQVTIFSINRTVIHAVTDLSLTRANLFLAKMFAIC